MSDFRAPNRRRPTFLQAINPVWWAGDVECNPNWSWWRWFQRNPFCNFCMTIIGVADCFRRCYYTQSPWTYAERGWNLGYTIIQDGHIPLPLASYRGTWIEFAAGWKTSGGFTLALRKANSPNAEAA